MGIRITKTTALGDFEKVYPSIIYNRYDLFCDKDSFEAVKIKNHGIEKVIEYKITNTEIELGIWLTPITVEELEKLIDYIKKKHQNVKKIIYKYGVIPYGKSRAHNNYRIEFPETAEEMKSRVSSQTWRTMRKRNRRAEAAYGEMRILEYNNRSDIPLEIVEAFFKYKLEIRNRVYNMTAAEYLDRYHVTDCYVVMFGDTIGAILFSCEQCPLVYGENHSYNPELREYSLGRFMYTHALIRMVEKKRTGIFLGGGEFEYKSHYGSIEETVYDCQITVKRESRTQKIKRIVKKILPSKVIALLKKIKKKLKK